MPSFLAALSMFSLVGSIGAHEAGAATEMPCAAPPTRVYPAGTGTSEIGSAGLAAGLPDPVGPDADGVAEPVGFTVTVAELHDVTATVIPKTTGSARPTTRMRKFCRLSGNHGQRNRAAFKAPLNTPGIIPGRAESRHNTTATARPARAASS